MTIFKLILGLVLTLTGILSVVIGMDPGLDSIEAHFCQCEGMLFILLGMKFGEKV